MKRADIEQLVDNTIDEFKGVELDPYGRQKGIDAVPPYLVNHRHEYVRTIMDVVNFTGRKRVNRVLEIGAFFGVVSICLSKLGFKVCALDLPEYMSMSEQQKRYARYNIETAGVRLEDYVLPYADEFFDVIIMCEVLEHLNFNPLPLLKEINRIGLNNSLLYLSHPNLTCLNNRLLLLKGLTILQEIQIFFDQLDPNNLIIANDHWRAYTGVEIRKMLERMGYSIDRQYYFSSRDIVRPRRVRDYLARLVFWLRPTFKGNLTTLAIRRRRTELIFHIPKTVHRTLRTL